jgi:NADH-quinone oxidoreductase subunit I
LSPARSSRFGRERGGDALVIKELVQGLTFTLKKMGTKPITVQYPEEQKPVSPRHRGRHILHRYDNGLERCIGCELCAAACPVGCIYVLAAENDPAHPVSPGERYAERYEINLMRCIYCGYCAEACPTEAITLGPRFELAEYRRERTVVTKAELLESWPGLARRPVSAVGAGADQTGREEMQPGVRPRVAWGAEELKLDHETAPLPGELGVPVDVPTVIEPGAGKKQQR